MKQTSVLEIIPQTGNISHVKYKDTLLSYYCFIVYAVVKRKYFPVTQKSFAMMGFS